MQLKQQQEEIRKLDVKDARLLNKNKDIFDKDGNVGECRPWVGVGWLPTMADGWSRCVAAVKPEDLDSLLQKERSLLQAMVLDEQQWARIGRWDDATRQSLVMIGRGSPRLLAVVCRPGSACVGSAVGLAVFPNHDFFGVLAGV